MSEAKPLLECNNLCISYFTRAGEIPAVKDFSLKLAPGEPLRIFLWAVKLKDI